MWKTLKKIVALTLVATTMHLGIVSAVQAALVGTEAVNTGPTAATAAERAKVVAFLDREDVAQQLDRLGVSAGEARARVAAMSDDEVREVSGRIDSLPAGGDAFGAIITAAVLVFIVLLITDILGLTKVFSFTRPMKR